MSYEEVALVLGREIRLFTMGDLESVETATCASIDVVDADIGGIGSAGVAMSFSVGDPAVSTPEGITVGSTLDDVLAAYPDARAEPNQYREWPDYYVDDADDDGTALALRFTIDDEDRVDEIYGGDLEFVSLPEGCA